MLSGSTSSNVTQSGALSIRIDTTRCVAALEAMSGSVRAGTGDPDIKAGVQDAANVYLGFIRRRFSTASGSPGNPWADLSPTTKYNRLRRAAGGFVRTKGVSKAARMLAAASIPFPILYETGNLYSSFVPGEPGYSEFWWEDGISFGSAVVYARYHQDGGGRLPRRAILVPPDESTLESMKGGIVSGLRASFQSAIDSV